MLSIGLMSGTSCDGIDAALIETDGKTIQKFIAEYHLPYPLELQKALSELMRNHRNWFELENQLTYSHAEAVKKLLASVSNMDRPTSNPYIPCDDEGAILRPVVIGFHGQTIYHAPDQGICWQIGNPHLLAHLTGIDVVSDFRRRDVANGGQGAPLVPIFHQALVCHHKLPVAIINIGGVSNMTYIGEDDVLLGCDLGPGNALINDAMMLYYNQPYDKDGIIAKSGRVDVAMVAKFMSYEFFKKLPPKSLDRNHFSGVMELLKNHKREDVIATLSDFTAEAMARGLKKNFLKAKVPEVLYLCGGGGKNKTIVEFLQDKLPNVKISHIEDLGFKSDYIEAQAFAYLAARYLKDLPSTFPTTTGVRAPTAAGVYYPQA